MSNTIKLQTDAILHVPFDNYPKDFTFYVNQQEYQTNKLLADLLSPVISKCHCTDPTLSEFSFNTRSSGEFEHFLQLLEFKEQIIQDNEVEFISEVIEILGITKSDININIKTVEVSVDNVIDLIKQHSKSPIFYFKSIEDEILFLSSHFHEISEKQSEGLLSLPCEVLCKVVGSEHLELENEDELLKFVNQLYKRDNECSHLYENVYFENVSKEAIEEFTSLFDIEHLTPGMWKSLSRRLHNSATSENSARKYAVREKKQPSKTISYTDEKGGIFSYFRRESSIDEEVAFTCSSCKGGDKNLLLQIENTENRFFTDDKQNEWICFEFKKHRVIPSSYTIRSFNSGPNSQHPRSWIIEGSEDGSKWNKLDEQTDCSYLNGSNIIYTFPIKDTKASVKYIRMRLTSNNWYYSDCNYRIYICSIDFSGQLI